MTSPPLPPAGPGDSTCPHPARITGICTTCGHCEHDVILNAACFYCGTTDLDPVALSPKKLDVIPASRLTRKP